MYTSKIVPCPASRWMVSHTQSNMSGGRSESGGATGPDAGPDMSVGHVGLEPTHCRTCTTRRLIRTCPTDMLDSVWGA